MDIFTPGLSYNKISKKGGIGAAAPGSSLSEFERSEQTMKKLSLLLALVMLLTCTALPSLAEESAIKESASGFYYIEAEGDQIRLSAADASKFFQADGLRFKDMNGNGE